MTESYARLSDALASRYSIERPIARGGMATVYLARDLRHDRLVAVKAFAPESPILRGAERFLDEIRIAAGLAHPNILPLHDSGEAGGFLYYVMPYVPGENLRQRLDREGPLPVREAIQIAREVAEALAFAHSHNVVHRDIKPENILFLGGHAVVADFGIAGAISRALRRTSPMETDEIEADDEEEIPPTIPALGTPHYMSPEQGTGTRHLDGRSDIYSLGCVLYEMLSGEPPFKGPTVPTLAAAHLHDPVPPLRAKRRAVGMGLTSVVETALAKVPADRFSTASRFAEALANVEVNGSGPVASPMRRWRWALAALVIVLIGFGVVLLHDAFGTLPVDESLYLVVPFEHRAGAAPELLNGDQCESLLYAALSRWDDVRLVDPLWVRDARLRSGKTTSLTDGLALARERGAGRLLSGEVWVFRDTVRVRAVLYDVAHRGTLLREKTVPINPNLSDAEAKFELLADSLLVGDVHASAAAGGAMGTHSIAAWRRFDEGHVALEQWDLTGARQRFREAVVIDPGYAQAHLWLAQVMSWNGDSPADWRDEVAQGLAPGSRLTPPDRAWGEALLALGEGRLAQSCEKYRVIRGRDTLDFRAWYGLGECQSRDRTVVRDAVSPSGWRFNASYQGAIDAYRRALSILPSFHLAFRGAAFARLAGLLFTENNRLHTGYAVERDTLWFAAFPTLQGDSLAFVPYPIDQVTGGSPRAFPPTSQAAVTRNREVLRQITATWVRDFPRSADAAEQHALVLETLGWLNDTRLPDQSALVFVRRARKDATEPAARARLGASEVRLLVKLDQAEMATRLADSLLGANKTPDPAEAWSLAGLAAITGRGDRAAELLARSAGLYDPHAPDGTPLDAPLPVKESGRALLAFAAMGGPIDSVNALEGRFNDQVQSYIEPARRARVREAFLDQPRFLLPETWTARTAAPAAAHGLALLQVSMARGDTGTVRREFSRLDALRGRMRAGDVAMEFTFQEARLLLRLGDTASAMARLDGALGALPTLGTDLLTEVPQAAALVRAMALRAELASRRADGMTAAHWGRDVVTLWGNADPALRPTVDRMRSLTRAP